MKASLALALFIALVPVPVAADPIHEGEERCHMHKETGALHCPKRQERERDKVEHEPAPLRQVYFRNCAAARAAGVAPIRRGEPGYRPALDRDGDGWACEPYRGRR